MKWFDLFLHIEHIWALWAKLIYSQLGQIIKIYDFPEFSWLLAAALAHSVWGLTGKISLHSCTIIDWPLKPFVLLKFNTKTFLFNVILLRWLHSNLSLFLITFQSPPINLWNINGKSLFSTFFYFTIHFRKLFPLYNPDSHSLTVFNELWKVIGQHDLLHGTIVKISLSSGKEKWRKLEFQHCQHIDIPTLFLKILFNTVCLPWFVLLSV